MAPARSQVLAHSPRHGSRLARQRQTPEALAAFVKADAEKWWPIMKEFGIKAE
jgi:tripartite-type tricarboxylate transporter receptor subunit TctC